MKTRYWGVALPGLAMNADELPAIDGLWRLQNPEVGSAAPLRGSYSLADTARAHLETLVDGLRRGELPAQGFTVIGMSMGAMIASYLASHYRDELPREMQFVFLVTSANTSENPAVPGATLDRWLKVNPAEREEFIRVMTSFFSPDFAIANPDVLRRYADYRAAGGNQQTPRAFYRQLTALRLFKGEETFPKVAPDEALFIGARDDMIFGPRHNEDLRALNPRARHVELAHTGHLVNFERPELFRPGSWRDLSPKACQS